MTEAAWLTLDLLLAGSMVALGWAALRARDPFAMVVFFIVLGLLAALAWVRLGAPDVALAEAAVGAGVTGALMLRTVAHLRRRPARAPEPAPKGPWRRLVGLAAAGITVAVAAAHLAASRAAGLAEAAHARLAETGVGNPVTAVLLSYRAIDTLLEMVVLFAALLCVALVARAPRALPAGSASGPALGPIFAGFGRIVLPLAVIVGAWLLWLGAERPGGAFQGGAVLAAVGIVLALGRLPAPMRPAPAAARATFAAGAAVFTLAGAATALGGGPPFAWPEGQAKLWILTIESVVTVSIAATLAALFRDPAPDLQAAAPRGAAPIPSVPTPAVPIPAPPRTAP